MYRRQLVLSSLLSASPFVCAEPLFKAAYDVIVIGSGVAGLSAAASAVQNGAKRVLVIEKAPTLGGHSILSTGYVSAVDSKRQKLLGIKDSPDLMLEHMLAIGGGKNNKELAGLVCEESESVINWLEDIGVRWEDKVVQTVAGLFPRSHISSSVRAGYDYVIALNKYARAHGVRFMLSTKAETLITKGGFVVGVVVRQGDRVEELGAGSVILATGGYTANKILRKKYDPRLTEDYVTTANPFGNIFDGATGDGLIMAQALGADTAHLNYIQLIPFWGGRLLDYVGADIFVNKEGKRFVSESESWKVISDAILRQPGQTMWAITDSQSRKGASLGVKLMRNVVAKADTITEMARIMAVDPQVLERTITRYNAFAKSNSDPDFNKNCFTQTISLPPYYFGKERLFVHFCCGGIKFDRFARVLREDGSPIEGLFVAGEAAGGVHGHDRMGGVAMTAAFVFGRIAGREACRL